MKDAKLILILISDYLSSYLLNFQKIYIYTIVSKYYLKYLYDPNVD